MTDMSQKFQAINKKIKYRNYNPYNIRKEHKMDKPKVGKANIAERDNGKRIYQRTIKHTTPTK